MKKNKKIFTKILGLGGVIIAAWVGVVEPAMAAVDNTGCDKENNVYINPELALCSTHVYNIGDNENPKDAATEQLMQEVVALKTTVIAQQLYAQYEFLETTLKRLKTQLQKQILLDQLEAAGVPTSSGSSSSNLGVTGNKSIALQGARDCQWETGGTVSVLQCIQNNINLVRNAANSDVQAARKQLEIDLGVAVGFGAVSGSAGKYSKTTGAKDELEKCNEMKVRSASTIGCASELNAAIIVKIEELQKSNNKNQYYVMPQI